MAEKQSKQEEGAKALIAIRVRGHAQTRASVEQTLWELALSRKNHCVIVPATESYKGMLQQAKDFITFGDADEQTILKILETAPLAPGGKKLTGEFLAKNTPYKSAQELAHALAEGKTTLSKVPKIKRVARLKPPKGGFGTIKQAYPKGSLGKRGKEIGKLVESML